MKNDSGLPLLFFVFLGIIAISCGKETTPSSDETQRNVELAYYAGSAPPEEGFPLLALESEGDVLVYYNDKDLENTASFFYQECGNDSPVFLSVGEEALVFSPFDSVREKLSPVIVLSSENGFVMAFLGEIDLKKGDFVCKEVIPLETVVADQTKASYNYGDDIRGTILRSFYKSLNESKEKCERFNVVTMGKLSAIPNMIANLVTLDFILASMELVDGAGDELKEEVGHMYQGILSDTFIGGAINVVTKRIPIEESRPLAGWIIKKMLAPLGKIITDKEAIERSDEVGMPVLSRMRRASASVTLFDPSEVIQQFPWRVSHSVKNVGKTFITVKGEAKEDDGYGFQNDLYSTLSSQGFELLRKKDGESSITYTKDLTERQIRVEPATEYFVSAFVTTFSGGHKCSSLPERVFSRGTKLVLSSQQLTFSMKGGSKTVTVEVGDGATWSIVGSVPSWCMATGSGPELQISVKGGKTRENCEITVQTQSVYGETEQAKILVARDDELRWDGTSWIFKWPAGCPEKRSGYGDYDIAIESVQKGVYWSNYDTAYTNARMAAGEPDIVGPSQMWEMKQGDNGTVVLYYYEEIKDNLVNIKYAYEHTIRRTSADRATMEWTYRQYQKGKLTTEEKYTLNGEIQ